MANTTIQQAPSTPRAPTIVYGDAVDRSDETFRYLPPVAVRRVTAIEQSHRADVADTDAAIAVHRAAVGDHHFAVSEFEQDKRLAQSYHRPLDPEREAFHVARVSRTVEARAAAQESVTQKGAKANRSRGVVNGVNALLNTLAEPVEQLEADATLPKGMTYRQAVAAEHDDHQQQLRQTESQVRKAEPGVEHAFAQFQERLDKIAETPAFEIVHSGGAFDVRFATVAVHAEAAGGLPVAPDHRPAYVKEHREEILAAARKEIDEHYAYNVALVLSADEKRTKLRKLADGVLASERRECALIWAAREEGEYIEFRSECPAVAILGITGSPPPKKRF